MNLFRKSCYICMQNFRKWSTNYRIWVLAILISLFISNYTKDIINFSNYIGEVSSPWFFPFLFGQRSMQIIIFMGIILIFCDAPFIDETHPYMLIRSGRIPWTLGQISYIFLTSAIYFLFICIISILLNITQIDFNSDWGKVLGTLSQSNSMSDYGVEAVISSKIVSFFNPFQAMYFTFLLTWLAGVFLGLLIYVLNVISNTRIVGICTASFFVLLDIFLKEFEYPKLFLYSPITWSDLRCIDIDGASQLPTINFILIAYSIIIFVLIILSIIFSKKQPVEILPPV